MKITIAGATLLIFAASASANSGMNSTSGLLDRVVQGHAQVGDTARSMSDPEVTFRVLDSGKVERTNVRLGTVSITDTKADWYGTHRNR